MSLPPKEIKIREEINLKHGIKSSMPSLKSLFAGVYTLYKILGSSKIQYSTEYQVNSSTRLRLESSLKDKLLDFYAEQLEDSGISSEDFISRFEGTPLFCSQIESLQVSLELYWKLGKIVFTDGYPNTKERTGGNRYNKILFLSTNIDILDNLIIDSSNILNKLEKNLIFNYLMKSTLNFNSQVEKKIIKILTIFSENTEYKIRMGDELSELFFQQEGIYSCLIEGNKVISKDSHEEVGPFRILKRAVKENLNYNLEDSLDHFEVRDSLEIKDLENYYNRVNVYLDLISSKSNNKLNYSLIKKPAKNKIFYGAPGTGKSFRVNQLIKGHESHTQRVTFHPELDYHSFVGSYKPFMVENEIQYKFVPQVFTNIYVDAWNDLSSSYYLIIEEINRGNCAEIFGDIFQLLDRNSDYPVTPSIELQNYLEAELADCSEIDHKKLLLPPNLNIFATMNTSDQSLFPMDSAFKRRWDWEYVHIDYSLSDQNKSSQFIVKISDTESFSWLSFIKNVNKEICKNFNLGLDKCVGNYFVNPSNYEIELDVFINKVIFYLWNDVFKDEMEEYSIFKDNTTYEDFFPIETVGLKNVKGLLDYLAVSIEKLDEIS